MALVSCVGLSKGQAPDSLRFLGEAARPIRVPTKAQTRSDLLVILPTGFIFDFHIIRAKQLCHVLIA